MLIKFKKHECIDSDDNIELSKTHYCLNNDGYGQTICDYPTNPHEYEITLDIADKKVTCENCIIEMKKHLECLKDIQKQLKKIEK